MKIVDKHVLVLTLDSNQEVYIKQLLFILPVN